MIRPIGVLLLSCGIVFATAGDFELGLSAYERGDYAEALAQWLPLAEVGNAEAQYRVGRLYYYGRGVSQDYAEAARWYRLAAEQGHARSQGNLAAMYEVGRGVPRDEKRAAAWYAKAAEQGRAFSQHNLGRMYEEGRGVPEDEQTAAALYAAAARQGLAEAQYRLARMYESGRGVPQDTKKATKWYRRAAKNGYDGSASGPAASTEDIPGPPAASGVAAASPATEGTEPTKLTEAEPGARDDASAAVPTGDLAAGLAASEQGNYDAALAQWLPLAESGNAEAQYQVATLYRLGRGVEASPSVAAGWYRAAAEQGHGPSMYCLALMFFRGRAAGWEKDWVRAYVWFSLAAERGVGDSAQWRDDLAAKLSRRELAEAKRRIAEAGQK